MTKLSGNRTKELAAMTKIIRSNLHRYGFAPMTSAAEDDMIRTVFDANGETMDAVAEIANSRIDRWNARNVK